LADSDRKLEKIALFLGGGAPISPSGALLALRKRLPPVAGDQRFEMVSMVGAGAVVGLLYSHPNV